MNYIGLSTIFIKEIERSRAVLFQAIVTPTISTVLYFIVFGAAIGNNITSFNGITYGQFIVPGLIMMSLTTNALTASASGIYFPRFIGTAYEFLTAPLSYIEIIIGFAGAALVRGLFIGVLIYLTALLFTPLTIIHPFFTLFFAVITTATFALLGIITGIWAKDFERLFLLPTLIITPLSFLGGTFYSIDTLPSIWQKITLLNPMYYMIDGLRYGFFGISEVNPLISIILTCVLFFLAVITLSWIFRTGYRLKN